LPIQSLPYILALGMMYGTTVLASRFAVGQFAPTSYVGLRLLLAGTANAAVYLFGVRGKHWPHGKELWWKSAVLAVFGTAIPMNFLVASLQFQSSGVTAMLITLNPAITVVLAHFFLSDEQLSARKLFGVVLALSGAVLMLALGESGLPDVSKLNPLGYLLVFSGMVSSSASTIFARRSMQCLDSVDVSSVRLWVAGLIVIPLSILISGFDLSAVTGVGYLALGWASLAGTFLATLMSFFLIKKYGATAAALTAYVTPVVASFGGAVLLGEQITGGIVAGMALIIGGIAFINRKPKSLTEVGVREIV
jgi:drug/metabolite transporter (DMT)-like permease